MPKFYLYARKSTDEEDRQVLSIESQMNELREFAKKENLNIVDEFTEAKTAKEPGRPIFSYMLKQIETGLAEGILAWHLLLSRARYARRFRRKARFFENYRLELHFEKRSPFI